MEPDDLSKSDPWAVREDDQFGGQRVVAVREWRYPDDTSVREIVTTCSLKYRRMYVVLSGLGSEAKAFLTPPSNSYDRPVTRSAPLKYYHMDYRTDLDGASVFVRSRLLAAVEREFGLNPIDPPVKVPVPDELSWTKTAEVEYEEVRDG